MIKEGDTITLGDTKMKVYILPGHHARRPPHASSPRMDKGKKIQGVRIRRPGPAQRASTAAPEFLKSIERLEKSFADVQVAVNVHSFLNSYPVSEQHGAFWSCATSRRRTRPDRIPFINNALWRQWLKEAHRRRAEMSSPTKRPRRRARRLRTSASLNAQFPISNSQGEVARPPAAWELLSICMFREHAPGRHGCRRS